MSVYTVALTDICESFHIAFEASINTLFLNCTCLIKHRLAYASDCSIRDYFARADMGRGRHGFSKS